MRLDEQRGGALFFALFCLVGCQGRFMALFYEEHGLDDMEIGALLSANALISIVACPAWTGMADSSPRVDAKEQYVVLTLLLTEVFFVAQYAVDLGWVAGAGVFWHLFACRVLGSIFFSAWFPLVTAICIQDLIDTHGKEGSKRFGTQRLWGAVSWLIVNFILGILIDAHGTRVMYVGHIVFTLVNVALIKSWVVVKYKGTRLKSEWAAAIAKEAPASDLSRRGGADEPHAGDAPQLATATGGAAVDEEVSASSGEGCPAAQAGPAASAGEKAPAPAAKIFDRRVAVMLCASYPKAAFFLLIFAMGAGMSIVENLVFLYFTQELGASSFLCGVSVGVTVAFEIPLFFVSHKLLTYFTTTSLIAIAVMSYVVRVVVYTLVPNGWWVLAVEPLHGVTIALMSVASQEFLVHNAPEGRMTSAQGVMSSTRGTGFLLGTFSGGQIISHLGQKALYRIYGGMVFAALLVYIHAASTAVAEDVDTEPAPTAPLSVVEECVVVDGGSDEDDDELRLI